MGHKALYNSALQWQHRNFDNMYSTSLRALHQNDTFIVLRHLHQQVLTQPGWRHAHLPSTDLPAFRPYTMLTATCT